NAMLRVRGVHAGNVDQVRDDGARGRFRPGARAVVKGGSDGVALDQHRVHRPFDVGDQTLRRHQRRMNPELDAFAVRATLDRSACASASTVANGEPVARISERMKLLVPLMMPAIHSMRLAVSPSRSALMIGMPPATAASNATITPVLCAAAKISLP